MQIRIELPGNESTAARHVKAIVELCAAMWATELVRRPLPKLYAAGVEYREEPNRGRWEEFADPYTVRARGWGDCDDLAIYRIAELLASGERASCITRRKIGTLRMHVLVRRGNGSDEDPSALVKGSFRDNYNQNSQRVSGPFRSGRASVPWSVWT
jgi:hypothetical protein